MNTKVDILAIGAHPDDVELGCAGTILAHIALGKKVGILDLTKGEKGTRGTPEIRLKEASQSAQILGAIFRENAGMQDTSFINDQQHQYQIIHYIRKYQPAIVLANALSDRHPDHAKAAQLIRDACFLSGLQKIETYHNNSKQKVWRPKAIYHYIQSQYTKPDVIVDISEYWEKKKQAIIAFESQFYNPNSQEKETYISTKNFLQFVEARAREFGQAIEKEYGEGFNIEKNIGVKSLFDLL